MPENPNRIVGTFLKYRDALIRALLRLSVRPEDVDDILQESLARAIEADQKSTIDLPKSYLFAVSRNLVFREQERRSREVLMEIDEAIIDSKTVDATEEAHSREMLDVFCEAMQTLPASHQRAIILRRVYGLSHREVATKMGVSLSSVEKYYAKGIRRCQQIMDKRGYVVGKSPFGTGASGFAVTPVDIKKGRGNKDGR